MNYFDGSTQPKAEKVFKSLWKHYIKSSRVNGTSVYYAKRCHLLNICKKPKMVSDGICFSIWGKHNTCRMEIRLFNDTNRLYDFIDKGEEGNYDGIAFTWKLF